MASLTGTKIKDTYDGLIKTIDNGVVDATAKELSDGLGNGTGVYVNTAGDLSIDAELSVGTNASVGADLDVAGVASFGSLKDTAENITVTKFVDAADGIAANNNDTSIPTSAAVKTYVDANITAQDLDFAGDAGIGAVDLDSQVLTIAGTANEIETSASGQTITIGLPSSVTVGSLAATTLSGALTGNVTGNLTGNVTGDLTGDVTGNVSGNVTGDLTGNVTGNLTGNVSGNVSGNLTGSVLTAAQTNITSVGTLSSLAVSGAATVGTNLAVSGALATGLSTATSGWQFQAQSAGEQTVLLQNTTTTGVKILMTDQSYSGEIQQYAGDIRIKPAGGTIQAATFSASGDISFRDSSANDAFYWDASASSLGIGTTSVDSKLKVEFNPSGTVLAGLRVGFNNSSSNIYDADIHYFRNGTGGLERMRIDSSGNVGIGEVPSGISGEKLISVKGTDYGTLFVKSTNVAGNIRAHDPLGLMILGTYTNHPVVFTSAGYERMRITSGGYLKASNDGTYRDVSGAFHEMRSSAADYISVETNSSGVPYGTYIFFETAVNNTTNEFLRLSDVSSPRCIIRSNGGIANYQANDVNLSDERVKTDISPLGSYWDKIKAIEIVNFKYKDQSHNDFNIGVIAQQVESVAPEFVDADGFDNKPKVISEEVLDEEGNVIQEAVYEEPLAEPLKAVYTADLYHAAIKVLQEAMARIEVLETELNALKQA